MTNTDVTEQIKHIWLDDQIGTHTEVCYTSNPRCAIATLVGQIDDLRCQIAELARERDSWQNRAMSA